MKSISGAMAAFFALMSINADVGALISHERSALGFGVVFAFFASAEFYLWLAAE